jgi:hypothetical protein
MAVIFTSTLFNIGCDNDNNNDYVKSKELTKSANLVYLNDHRSQLVMDDGYTVNITSSTIISRQRPSCSGFEQESVYEYELGDMIEYTYIEDGEVNYSSRVVDAVKIKAWSQDCLNPEKDIQYVIYLDTDKDGYPNKYDSAPTDPAVH